MATHSSILAWRIPWTGELGEATVHGAAQSWTQPEATEHSQKLPGPGGAISPASASPQMSKHQKIQKMKDMINTTLFSPKAALF